jgi:GNAT superfamily N-acetyltransferase
MHERIGDFPSQQGAGAASTRKISISSDRDQNPNEKRPKLRTTSEWPNPTTHSDGVNPLFLPFLSQAERADKRDVESRSIKLAFATERVSASNLASALEISKLCFPKHGDQIQIAREYSEWVSGNRSFFEPTLEHEILIHEDLLFKIRGEAVAIGGIYQYPEEPDRMWLSWFGVHPDYRGIKLGAVVLNYCQERASELGARRFAAYTDDGDYNARCHLFYESCGYINIARFTVGRDMMRVYEVSLGKGGNDYSR